MKGTSGKAAIPTMRYISLLEYGAWYVRVPGLPSKTFFWEKYGGKTKSLNTARKWRDNHCQSMNIAIGNNTRGLGNCRKGAKGYCLVYSKTRDNYSWKAHHYYNGKNKTKHFAVVKYGFDHARRLAIQQRVFWKTGVLMPFEDIL